MKKAFFSVAVFAFLLTSQAWGVSPTTPYELEMAIRNNQDISLDRSIDFSGHEWGITYTWPDPYMLYSAHFNGNGNLILNFTGQHMIQRLAGNGIVEKVGFVNANMYDGIIMDLGFYQGPHTAQVSEVFVQGQMSGSGSQNRAGIVGIIRAGYISDCWADYPKTGGWCGGVVGYAQSGFISNSYALTSDVIGYVESHGAPLTINSVYYNSDLTTSAGGTPLSTVEMMMKKNFVGWDFVNIWKIDEGRYYPQLRNVVPEPATILLLGLGAAMLRKRR